MIFDDIIDLLNVEVIVILMMIEDFFCLDGVDWFELLMDDASRDVIVDDAIVFEVFDLVFYGGLIIIFYEYFLC